MSYEDISRPRGGQDARPELADVRRLARRLMRRAVMAARADDEPARQLLVDHLGPGCSEVPIASGSWPGADAVIRKPPDDR